MQTQAKLQYLATHDALTSLPNRSMFQYQMEHAITLAKREEKNIAVFFLDLDNFKQINDAAKYAGKNQFQYYEPASSDKE